MEKILGLILDIISVLFSIIFLTLALINTNNVIFDTNTIRQYKVN